MSEKQFFMIKPTKNNKVISKEIWENHEITKSICRYPQTHFADFH